MKYGTLSSYVRSISLMKLNGELKEYHYEDDKDLFHCLACSLGTFAIIVSIRLQVSPSFHLELNQYMLEFRSFVNTLSIHYSSSDHFRYMWYPYTNSGIAYHLTRILPRIINNNDNNSLFSRIWSWFKYSLIGIVVVFQKKTIFHYLLFRSSSSRIIILFFIIYSLLSSIYK